MILTLLLTSTILLTSTFAQYNQKAGLFTGLSGTGSFTNLIENYFTDLRTLNFDDKAYSTCVTGIWLFYDQKNFNPSNALMEYVFGPANIQNLAKPFCVDFQNLAGRLSSARFAGSPKDYRSDTLTLYQGTYFQGEEEYTYVDLTTLNLDKRVSSLILTGVSPWTIYDGTDFTGNSICVYPPSSNNYTPALIYDTTMLNVPHRTIRSVQKGCFGQERIMADNLPQEGMVNLAQLDKKSS